MPSIALEIWNDERRAALDEIESAHRVVAGLEQVQTLALRQIHQAYAVLLSSQFQGYCRDLHSECILHLLPAIPHPTLRRACELLLAQGRKLDRGNPNPGNIGSDFGRFGLAFWGNIEERDLRNQMRKHLLERLNTWRNAISHQDFESDKLSMDALEWDTILGWRRACEGLAISFDEVMRDHVQSIVGRPPW
jgi:hypothetical protein